LSQERTIKLSVSDLAHIAFGIITAIVSKINIIFSILNTILFIIYELNEEWRINDYAYEDIREFVVGLTIGEVLLLALGLLRLW
jgi:hypothetical protein